MQSNNTVTTNHLAHPLFLAIMDDDLNKRMCEQLYQFSRQSDKTQVTSEQWARVQYIAGLFKILRVRGFRQGKAPAHLLIKSLCDGMRRNSEQISLLLKHWAHSHEELLQTGRQFLEAQNDFLCDLFAESSSLSPVEEARNLATAYQQEADDIHPDDALLLMVYLLSSASPFQTDDGEVIIGWKDQQALEEEEEGEEEISLTDPLADMPEPAVPDASLLLDPSTEEPEQVSPEPAGDSAPADDGAPTIWEPWLASLAGYAEDDPLWDRLDEFLVRGQALLAQKLAERTRGVQRLAEAIAELQAACEAGIEFWGHTEAAGWQAGCCPREARDACLETLAAYRRHLAAYTDLDVVYQSTPPAQRRKLRQEQESLETQIGGEYSRLCAWLLGAAPVPPGAGLEPEDERSSDGETSAVEEDEPPVSLPESPLPAEAELPAPVEEAIPADDALPEAPEGPPVVLETSIPAEVAATPVPEAIAAEKAADPDLPPELLPAGTPTSLLQEKAVEAEAPEAQLVLLTSSEIAGLLAAGDRAELWCDFCWALVAEQHISLAYWAAKSLATRDIAVPLPAELLAAFQGACWLRQDTDRFVADLNDIASRFTPDPDSIPQGLIALASALCTTLIKPHAGLHGWLQAPAPFSDALYQLIEAVSRFSSTKITLQPEHLRDTTGHSALHGEIKAVEQQAATWLNQAQHHSLGYQRASKIWRNLVSPHGMIYEMLSPVTGHGTGDLEQVQKLADFCRDRAALEKKFKEINLQLDERRARQIEGPVRDSMIKDAGEAADLADRWLELVKRNRQMSVRGNWITEQVDLLRQEVERALPAAEDAIAGYCQPEQGYPITAAACCLLRALQRLRELLGLPGTPDTVPLLDRQLQQVCTTDSVKNLEHALCRTLLLVPEVMRSRESTQSCSSPQLLTAIRESIADERTLERAFHGWLAADDYRYIENPLLQILHDLPHVDELREQYQDRLEGSRQALREAVDELRTAVEKAMVDGIIQEDERTDYDVELTRIIPEQVLNFRSEFDELKALKQKLKDARERRLAHQRKSWKDLRPRVENLIVHENRDEVLRLVQVALEHGDTRVVDEYLGQLREAADDGAMVDASRFRPDPPTRNALAEFLHLLEQIEEGGEEFRPSELQAALHSKKLFYGIPLHQLDEKRRDEVERVYTAWTEMRRGTRSVTKEYLNQIMQFIGFQMVFLRDGDGQLSIRQTGADWVHAAVTMSASDLARPIPQFGTLAHNRYEVICLWKQPGADTIRARLHELRQESHNPLIIYIGRLNQHNRQELVRVSREAGLSIALLDEALLFFLAGEQDARGRLQVFLRCALPFAFVNPYVKAGEVPSEMFYGREQMADELINPHGASVVFGGRQLGKSTLLRHIERRFHNPGEGRYARVKNIYNVGRPTEPVGMIWQHLYEALVDLGLANRSRAQASRRLVMDGIRNALKEKSDRRIILMLDEADKFLEADSKSGFSIVSDLEQLMNDTERRFKVIFAGLNSVMRYQAMLNQPLSRLGSICVTPFPATIAQKLVREPLEALGYEIPDEAVLRILSYTNYHPGILQYVCHQLVAQFQQPGIDGPPFRITLADIEQVYNQNVREFIKERFDLTLRLDARYAIVAYAMIFDQMMSQIRDSYAREYSVPAILELVADFWQRGQELPDTLTLKGVLEEMRGLGVLVRTAQGHYRLRSPNMVRLIGDENEILEHLQELSESESEAVDPVDHVHQCTNRVACTYSPLSCTQEKLIALPGLGVGLLFASEALGLRQLPGLLENYIPVDEDEVPPCAEVPGKVQSGRYFVNWLTEFLNKHRKSDRLLVYRTMLPVDSNPVELVREAMSFCRQRDFGRNKVLEWFRIMFIFPPASAWTWCLQPEDERLQYQTMAIAAMSPRRWTPPGIEHRLVEMEIHNPPGLSGVIADVTGGWPLLVDQFFTRCRQDKANPRDHLHGLKDDLHAGTLRKEFQEAMGLVAGTPPWVMLEFLADEAFRVGVATTMPGDLITPEFIDRPELPTSELCRSTLEYLALMQIVIPTVEGYRIEPVAAQALFDRAIPVAEQLEE
ncbi:MAG: AAA family ATPase [Armatimonadota bacterium]